LPDSLNIDVTKLALGGTIAAGDLKFDNIQILTPASTIVCMVKMTRASISDAAAEAAEEAEEGAAEENAAEKHEEA
jgi:large subunit ribosomal protein L25